ncbi:Helix-turn-helix [Chryseobacterium piscicola]|uniref:Helix-turn-helix n=1 Tax=Chryseobacterium piscicola TaxID=551459 RepID=A0A1N7N9Y3_9FLAO|nr:helix-turn-helix transcriptional regulator [Chryseobacterium piscicola]PQA92251.1 hypothetical protein B0A70_11565 [Chryseobacterium piscicola]SIS95140.1 Helix-turn-helix [Chryseobacterium piscicola]
MTNKERGFRLRKFRERKNISQETLAIDLGIPQSKVSKIENGSEKATLEYLEKIKAYFSISCDEMKEFLQEA